MNRFSLGLKILIESSAVKYKTHSGSCWKPYLLNERPVSKARRTSVNLMPITSLKEGLDLDASVFSRHENVTLARHRKKNITFCFIKQTTITDL